MVDAHGPGTRYTVKAGIHLRNFSVQPKSGDTFCGEPGAVLDGGRTLKTAFSGDAINVTLDSITVQEYNSGWQGGAIHPDARARGWVVRNVSALRNYWAGLMAADGMRILGGHYNDNDQLGISGNAATGIVLDGVDGDPTTFDGPEMARNRTLHADCTYEAGGMKWDRGQVTIRNAHVHDNDCRGLWADINARGALIEHNLIEDNREEGIYYEISQDAVIRDNHVYGNGLDGPAADRVLELLTGSRLVRLLEDAGERRYELVLQYWVFDPYHDGANNPEGDWEHLNVSVTTAVGWNEVTGSSTMGTIVEQSARGCHDRSAITAWPPRECSAPTMKSVWPPNPEYTRPLIREALTCA